MAEAASRTGAESATAAVRMTTRAAGGGACDLVAATTGVRGIGGKPRCC